MFDRFRVWGVGTKRQVLSTEKQFIILVGKGREGWNCRSLFGVALYREPRSKIFAGTSM